MRILVVEDDEHLRRQLVDRLRQSGYAVDAAADGAEGLYYAREYPVDLAVIDLGLPELPGIELIRQLRQGGSHLPILVLTARDHWQDKVEGLEAGADDYMAKPFRVEELIARIKALVRRAAGHADSIIRCGDVELDTAAQEVSVAGRNLDLTAYEYRMLNYMMINSGKVISKSELTDHIYDEDADRDSNVIEVFIGRLRKKLDPGNSLRPIETLRGRGYRFNVPLSP